MPLRKLTAVTLLTIKGVCLASGTSYEFDYQLPYFSTVNDPGCVAAARKVVENYLGRKLWHEMPRALMGGEEFSFYLRDHPGAFCFVGVGVDSPGLHNPRFNFHDEAIRNGINYLVAMTLETQAP